MSVEFKVVSLNCWGLPIVAKDRLARIHAIAEALATSSYDVVCMQEVWLERDFQLMKNKVSGVLPYSHYFYSGVTGSGVCIFSKHVIEEAFFHQWSVNGYIHKLHHGDWFGGKGVGLCRLQVGNLKINVYSAHLHAEYDPNCDEYQAHRVLQAFDTAQFIKLTSNSADVAVLAGDLNTCPGDLAYRLIVYLPELKDAFVEWDETPEKLVATNESLSNSYTPAHLIRNQIEGKRIDYILYHSGSNTNVKLEKYSLPLPDRVPGKNFSYSDHEAVLSNFLITQTINKAQPPSEDSQKSALEDGIAICDEALRNLARSKFVYLGFTLVLLCLLLYILLTSSPNGFLIVFNILKVLITLAMFFTFIMATFWNQIEKHGVLSGRLAMQVALNGFHKKNI